MSTPTRQLAAIMFTDIVGYTAMMGESESKTMELVRMNKEVQKPLLEQYKGTLLKEMGDGNLVSFPTASDAIYCALAIQKSLFGNPDLNLRIGIHLGEIIVEEGEVYGDGVNIASRLESIADPGGIYISDSVQKAIRSNNDIQFALLGELNLKNVSYPVKTFALRGEFLPIPKEAKKKNLTGRFFAELTRRNVIRSGLAYLAISISIYYLSKLVLLTSTIHLTLYTFLIIGFPIAIWLAWNYERSPQGFVRINSQKAWENPYSESQKKPLTGRLSIIVLIAIVIGQFIYFNFGQDYSWVNGGSATASESSLAIIPFRNNTGDQTNDFIGIGFASEVGTSLALTKQFDFISSLQATIKYQGSNESPSDIATKLGVTHVLTGMYQTSGSEVQILVELVEAATNRVIWNLPLRTKFDDALKIQSQIASEVMKRFSIDLEAENQIGTSNMDAYALYTKALKEFSQSIGPRQALAQLGDFKRIIELDSSFIDPWLYAIVSQTFYHINFPNDTIITAKRIKPYVDYIDLNFPDSWQKNLAKGIYNYQVLKDFDLALEYIKRALNENPESRMANSFASYIYKRKFDFDNASRYLEKAAKIDPGFAITWNESGINFRSRGDYQNAEQAYLKLFETNNDLSGQLISLKRDLNDIQSLPVQIKRRMGKTYKADELWLAREFNELIRFSESAESDSTFTDLSKSYYQSLAYYALGDDRNAKKFALKFQEQSQLDSGLQIPFTFRPQFRIKAILNDFDDVPWTIIREIDKQDKFRRFSSIMEKFEFNIFNSNYEEATSLLSQVLLDFPELADYERIRTDPVYDRIKREYPKFQDLADKLPKPLISNKLLKM